MARHARAAVHHDKRRHEGAAFDEVMIMCGIVGIASKQEFSSKELLQSLKRLEYRGYDSFGYVTDSGFMEKNIGEISLPATARNMSIGISHCRWATHGGVTQANAHPHSSCDGSMFIVHNGIIDNYKELRNDMIKKGHKFKSETDSEVIAHFFEEELKSGSMHRAVEEFFASVKGEFAVLLLKKNSGIIYAFKRGSPLDLGIAEGDR